MRGACVSEPNVRRQLSGITLHVPGMDHLEIVQPAAIDPFAIETTPLSAVATFDPNRLTGRRVKVQGVVTLRMPGQGFILQDQTGGTRVLSRQTNEVALGDSLEGTGLSCDRRFFALSGRRHFPQGWPWPPAGTQAGQRRPNPAARIG